MLTFRIGMDSLGVIAIKLCIAQEVEEKEEEDDASHTNWVNTIMISIRLNEPPIL